MQSYVNAGDFKTSGKLRAALFNNAIYYGLYMIVFILLLIYAIIKGVRALESYSCFRFEHMICPFEHHGRGLFCLRLFRPDMGSLSFREAYGTWAAENEHGAREKAQIIVSKFPEEVISELFPARNAMEFSSLNAADLNSVKNDKYLIRLHKKVISSIQYHHRTLAQWRSLIKQALFLEDVAQAEITGRLESDSSSFLPEKLQYFWLVNAQRPLCKLVAMCIICYLCSCAYFTVFRLKIYQYYHLDPNRHTDGNSLLFSAILLCRLTPPICLNFLGMIHLDSHITMAKDFGVETQFTKVAYL
ncbi:LMBR1-like region [Cooperia oncophora]